jgi:hypothetical protein
MGHDLKSAIFAIIDEDRRFHRTNKNLTIFVIFDINTIERTLNKYFALVIISNFKN